MAWISWLLVALVAVLHIAFMAAEMFAWDKLAPRVAGLPPPIVQATKALGANQGLYNGFLAAGLFWSLGEPPTLTTSLALFFVVCVLIAGVFGALTIKPVNRGLLALQAFPALLALIALWLRG
jgi:putative membrane protein